MQDLARFLQKSSIPVRFLDAMAFFQDSCKILARNCALSQEGKSCKILARFLQELNFLSTKVVLIAD